MIDELSMTYLHRQTDATAGGPFEVSAQPLGTVQTHGAPKKAPVRGHVAPVGLGQHTVDRSHFRVHTGKGQHGEKGPPCKDVSPYPVKDPCLHMQSESVESQHTAIDRLVSLKVQFQRLEKRRPLLKEVLRPFAKIMIVGAQLRADLEGLPAPGIASQALDRLSEGVPLLADADLQEVVPELSTLMAHMLTALGAAFSPLKEDSARLLSRVIEDPKAATAWLRVLLRNEEAPLQRLSQDVGLEPEVLQIELKQVFKPYLQWLAHGLARHLKGIVWDRGYCPICGAYPDTSYLRRDVPGHGPLMAPKRERWLHCSLCSYEWRQRRVRCPYCGTEDADSLEYLAAKETPHEILYVCHRCHKYLTCLDTSELIEKPLSDLIPFELLHLDIIARQKGFAPPNRGHWNSVTA
jgi:FdhE protein